MTRAGSTAVVKRGLDFGLSLLALVLLWPLFVLVALAVWIKLGRPIFFVQERPGLGGRPFKLIKFRTMRQARGADGRELPDEQRLTPFGRLLRSTSLDELPELINVLKGEMSLVGPRPLLMEYLPLYSPEQMRRHEVKPGITGWAQVNGRNATTWEERFSLDLWYVDNHDLWLDLRILLMTLKKVLAREGISQQGRATMDKFRGNAGEPGGSEDEQRSGRARRLS